MIKRLYRRTRILRIVKSPTRNTLSLRTSSGTRWRPPGGQGHLGSVRGNTRLQWDPHRDVLVLRHLGPELVKMCTDHSRREQGGQKVRDIVGPPEYAATQKSGLRQQKRQDASVNTTKPQLPEGYPVGRLSWLWRSITFLKSQFMQRVVMLVTCVLGNLDNTAPPGVTMDLGQSKATRVTSSSMWAFSLELIWKSQKWDHIFRSNTLTKLPHPGINQNLTSLGNHIKFNTILVFDSLY